MNSAMLRIVQRRPFASVAATTIAGTISYATYVEKKANIESKYSIPREYNRDAIAEYWKERPISILSRISNISYELIPIFTRYVVDFKILNNDEQNEKEAKYHQHASELRHALTRLGPAFIKFGQQLSIRPDLLPASVLKELQKLCDAVEPVPDEIALKTILEDLGDDILSRHIPHLQHENGLDKEKIQLVAAASLGQVYKTKLKSGETVAIKVQRPDMVERVSLDLFLLNQYGLFLDTIFEVLTEQIPFHVDFIDCFAKGSYEELDYEKEAENQLYFKKEFKKRKCDVHIPAVHTELTSRRVITTEWIDGIKLTDADQGTIQRLIPAGVDIFMTQLLDIGKFHSDPHAGNLYVTENGNLCLLDFGLCADIDDQSRQAMTTAIVHLLNGDFDTLISKDAIDLGFLPSDCDTTEIKPILTKILTEGLLEAGSDLHARKRRLMSISNELNEVFFRYPFSVPPFFALITRGLGLLEGIALSGDSNFDIFQASYPYARKRAVRLFGAHILQRTATQLK